ncbi:CHAT domain-containing protein [Tahibacter aquaticus]|uniref:CHAT domain-containing protein n=1 Tax=Tahibacter aquaticus TaxID=520092 RepID=A0A4R6Z6Z4_9GAMM|nr:CHAT domain-containing tetratricopeptide repeat protein [Tahibacter aquaticus]TDR47558.1 CHAT domain-containing protein [Tahibacter aquaticus]
MPPDRRRCFRFFRRGSCLGVLLALLPVALPAADPAALPRLQPGQPQERVLQAGQSLQLVLDLPAAQALRLRVVEQGIDVEAQLVGATQRWRAEDDDILRWGEQRFALARNETGLRLELRAPRLGSPPGRVQLSLEAVELADSARSAAFGLDLGAAEVAQRMADAQRLREPQTAVLVQSLCQARRDSGDSAGYLRCSGMQERILARQSRRPEAIAVLEQALPVWRAAADPRGQASALNNLGMNHYWLGDGRLAARPLQQALAALDGVDDDLLRAVIQNNLCLSGALRNSLQQARTCYERALALSEASGDLQRIATAQNNLGGAWFLLGDSGLAAAHFERALALRRQLGDLPGSGDARYNLALVRIAQGQLANALQELEQASVAYRSGSNSAGEALALRSRGYVQLLLGEPALAVDLMQQALVLQRGGGRRDAVVATLARLAEAQLAQGDTVEARASADEAVAAAAVDASPLLQADTSLRAARIYRRGGDLPAAANLAEQALAAAAPLKQSALADSARVELAQLALLQGQPAQARTLAAAALKSRRLAVLPQLDAYTVIAAALRAEGQPAAAEAAYRRAIAATEQAATTLYDPELRASFFAVQREAQEGLIALLLEARDSQGGAARAAEALVLSEDFRARSLRDSLDTAGSNLSSAAVAEREPLLTQLAALALARWKLSEARSSDRDALRQLDREIRAAGAALRQLDDRLRHGALPRPQRAQLRIADLQQALPADTTLLVYRQQAQGSHAWVVQRDALHSQPLAEAAVIAAAVREVRASLAAGDGASGGQPPRWQAALAQACALVWQPLAARIVTPRVLIVADGELEALPFAALRCGDQPGYLVQRHELSRLPAAWLLLRPAAAGLRADYSALLVGDPVYSRDDARLGGLAPAAESATPALRNDDRRLYGSAQELQRIEQRLGAQHSTLLLGLSARLDNVEKVSLNSFDIVHFTTHGVDGGSSFGGSGLVLSLFDARGTAIDGFLSTRRIGAQRLRASLVVLAACDSANGRAIAGEGTLGVAYAFLQAGARHVVATLWPVQDGVMPELMDAFYADPQAAALRPAQALRRSQLQMLQTYPQASPALWAGLAVWGW